METSGISTHYHYRINHMLDSNLGQETFQHKVLLTLVANIQLVKREKRQQVVGCISHQGVNSGYHNLGDLKLR